MIAKETAEDKRQSTTAEMSSPGAGLSSGMKNRLMNEVQMMAGMLVRQVGGTQAYDEARTPCASQKGTMALYDELMDEFGEEWLVDNERLVQEEVI